MIMAKNFKTLQDKMPDSARKVVARRVRRTLELMALHELRRNRKLSQTQIAAGLNLGQSEISKIENRTDMRLSTLQDYVQALGGHLEMQAVFPDVIVPLELVTKS
jgi:predicted XRE-type DNA-binding protein